MNVGKAKTWAQDRKETDVHGEVTTSAWDKDGVHYAFPISKPAYQNIRTSAYDGKKHRFGAIKIAQDVLDNKDLGPVVIIHEATHKYAGTWDCWYYDARGEKVIKRHTRGYMVKANALQNADSYAWFMWNVSRLATTSFVDLDDEWTGEFFTDGE